MKVVEYINEVN